MTLTPEQARFLFEAIQTAYDTVPVTEIFDGDFDVSMMEQTLDQLRAHGNSDSPSP
jgi:hypothetical protein